MKKLVFFVFFVLLSFAGFSQSKKISALPTATNLNSSFVPIIQDSAGQYVNRKNNPLTPNGLVYVLSTDTTNGTGIERLKIDSVGNVSFPNTNNFDILTPESNGTIEFTSQSLSASDFAFYNQTNNYIDLYTNDSGGHIQDLFIGDDGLNNHSIEFNSGGGVFVIKTDESFGGYIGVERFKIDSVGNVSFDNTKAYVIDATDSISLESANGYMMLKNSISSTEYTISEYVGDAINEFYTNSVSGHASNYGLYDGGVYMGTNGIMAIQTGQVNNALIDRLLIDSVGNVDFPNTNEFKITLPSLEQFIVSDQLFNVSSNELSISGNPYVGIYSDINGGISFKATQVPDYGSGHIYLSNKDNFSIALTTGETLGGIHYNRLTIDSIGLINLTPSELIVNIASDAGTTGEYLGSDGAGSVVWGTPSDRKLKKNISPITGATKKILALDPVNFTYKKGNEKSVGFIAQDVQKVLPEMVSQKDGYLSLKNVTYLEPYIISTIQELEQRICELEKRLYKAEKKKHRLRYERKNKY